MKPKGRPSLRLALPHGAAAFTLVEVLMALVIFALMTVVLASAYLNVLTGYAIAARGNLTTEEVAFARAQMLAEPDRKVVEQGGDYDGTDNRHVRWSATIEPTNVNDLFTVTFVCEVTDPQRPEPEKVTQVFTVLRPTWSDPAERGKLLQDINARIAELQGKKPQ
jgi:general secretion pathway protein I